MMTFDQLPFLLKPHQVSSLTGLPSEVVRSMGDEGTLQYVVPGENGYRFYTRESLKKFLNVNGNEQIPN